MEIKRLLRRWFRRDVLVYLPVESSGPVALADYLGAWARISETPDGKIIIAEFRNQLMNALSNTCPTDKVTPQERSQWLAAHDAVISARRDLLIHAVHNVDLLRSSPRLPKPPAVASTER